MDRDINLCILEWYYLGTEAAEAILITYSVTSTYIIHLNTFPPHACRKS